MMLSLRERSGLPRTLRRLVAVGVLAGLASSAAPAARAASAAGPPGALALTVNPVAGDQYLDVDWVFGPGTPPDTVFVELYRSDNGRPVFVSRGEFRQTVEPRALDIPVPAGSWMVKVVPRAGWMWGPETWSRPVTVVNSCTGADLCARMSPSPASGRVRLVGQGLLFGVGQQVSSALDGLIAALRPRQWRFSGPFVDKLVRPYAPARTQVLSDLWFGATAPTNLGYAVTPWSDWDAWGTFVYQIVRRANQEGWEPDYWDVWNEPNGLCCPKFLPTELSTITTDRWLTTYEVAWRAIKAADPAAKVIGPSTSSLQWTDEQVPDPAPEFALDTFLAYSAQRGLVWDAVSWHESTLTPGWGDMGYSIANVDRHIALARAVIARHPGTVVEDKIFVNEFGAPEVHMLAGWTVGYLRAFEDGGVAQANRSCWSHEECANGMLSGLLDPSGQPTAQWWTHRLYTDLEGHPRMAVQSSASWHLDGLAVQDDATTTVRALLGRHWYCNRAVNWWCPYSFPIPEQSVRTSIDWPYGPGPVQVTVQRLPAGTTAVPALPTVLSQRVSPSNGVVTVTVPGVADGDALWIVATKAGRTSI